MNEGDLARILSYIPPLLAGAQVTVVLAAVSVVLATTIGLLVAISRVSKVRAVGPFVSVYLVVVRNTPELVQFYFLYSTLAVVGVVLPPFLVAVLVLGIHYGCYLSEVFRAAILSIERTQVEAALVLGLSSRTTWSRVILPQAARKAAPTWGNYFLVIIKTTALASAITVHELMLSAESLASGNFRYFEVFTLTGVIYFLICYPGSLAVRAWERRLNRHLVRTASS